MSDETNATAATPGAHEGVLACLEAAAKAEARRVEAAISAWLAEHIHNSPVSRATEAINHLVSVLPHLVTALVKGG